MRQIKFRAWVYGEMRSWEAISERDSGLEFVLKGGDEKVTIVPMQFTGLLDKNGREIYEGDIVKWRRHPNKERVSEVVWDEARGRLAFKDQDELERQRDFWTYSSLDCNTKEVIGNIYENPELLK